jgi:hypothetical protein
MKASSLSLAAVLAVATFNSASAGFVRGSFRTGFVPHASFARVHVNPSPAFRFGPIGTNGFRHVRRGFGAFFPGYLSYPSAPLPGGDASSADYSATAVSAPSYNTTIMISGPRYAYAPAFATDGGPKIIIIGAPSRSAHSRKMPIVVYGTPPVGPSY